jgi:anti-sigma factor RsiW
MRMTHQEIEKNEIIERYALNALSEDERRAFQEHFFACDECFDKAQMTARFIAGVRESSVTGVLAQPSAESKTASAPPFWTNWLKPAFVLATAVSLILAVMLGWLALNQIPKLRGDVEREKQAREQMEREKQQAIDRAGEELEKERQQLESERNERAKLQNQLEELARNRPPIAPEINTRPQADSPIVILEAMRDSQASNQLSLPANAIRATLWAEVESGNRFTSYSLQILTAENRLVETIAGAKQNSYGAVAVTVSAKLLQTGNYIVKLYGVKNGKRELLGDYSLSVRKR